MRRRLRTRSTERAGFFFPLLLSAVLFTLVWFLDHYPAYRPMSPFDVLLGRDLSLLKFAAVVPLILLVVRLFDSFIFDIFVARRRHLAAPQLLRDIVAIILYFIFFASAIQTIFKANVTTFLTTGTVIAAILGLALQDTLGNLFSGIALHMENSFEIGDVIRSGDHIGVVDAVTWRATRVRTFNNDVVILPNSVLARERIEVFPRGNLNARVLTVGVDYHVAPATVIKVLHEAASHVEGVARDAPVIARVGAFGDSAVVYEIKYFTRDYSARDRIDADIRKAVWYAMRRNHIAVPFPVRSFQPYAPPSTDHRIGRAQITESLRAIDLLAPLGDAALEAIADAASVHVFSRGEAILRRGEAGDSMFVVHDGTVSIRVPDEDGTGGTHEVAQLAEGTVFGEMALLTGQARTADVIALTEVTTIEIGKNALEPLLHEHPELANTLSAKVMRHRDALDSLRATSEEEAEITLRTRIRSWFGL